MGKSRRICKRRDFIRKGILGGAVLSLPLGRTLFSIETPAVSRPDGSKNETGAFRSRIYDIAQKYGAEFGAVKPVLRRHRNGSL